MSGLGSDVGFDVFDGFGKDGVLFHLLLHLLDGVEDGGVIPVVKLLADVVQGEVGHVPDQVHGHLPRHHGVTDALLAPDDIHLNGVMLADIGQDVLGGGGRW